MPLDQEKQLEFIKYLGIDPEAVESIEDAKTAFGESHIPVSQIADHQAVKSLLGKRFGETETKIKRAFKNAGVDFEPNDFKDKGIEEIIDLGEQRMKAKIEELKASASASDDKKAEALQAKLDTLTTRLEEEKGAKAQIEQEYEAFKTTVSEKETQTKAQRAYSEQAAKVKFKSDLKEVEKVGFNAVIGSKYDFSFDESGEYIVTDKSGNRIKNETKSGAFLSPAEVLEKEAQKEGLIALNPNGGKTVGGKKPHERDNNGFEEKPRRAVAKRLNPAN